MYSLDTHLVAKLEYNEKLESYQKCNIIQQMKMSHILVQYT